MNTDTLPLEDQCKKDPCTSQKALAIQTLRDKRVIHVPEARSFIVEGSTGEKYAVELHPQEKCQCPSLSTCYHIMAAKMSIGADDYGKKRSLNLSQLRKNSRKRPNKKAGRKQPRPCDKEDISIIPAPDSSKQSFICSTPTCDSDSEATPSILKRRKTTQATPVSRKKIVFETPMPSLSDIPEESTNNLIEENCQTSTISTGSPDISLSKESATVDACSSDPRCDAVQTEEKEQSSRDHPHVTKRIWTQFGSWFLTAEWSR